MGTTVQFCNDLAVQWVFWMLHVSWQVALLAGIVWVATSLLHKSAASFRYLLWLIVFCKLILPPTLSTPWSLGNFLSKPFISVDFQTMEDGLQVPRSHRQAEPAGDPDAPNVEARTAPRPSLRPLTLVMCGWAVVALGLLAGMVVQYKRYTRKVTRGLSLPPDTLQNVFASLAETLKVRSKIPLGLSPAVHTPALFGFLRSAVLLPKSLQEQLSAVELSDVIAHELAHVKRRDLIVGGLAAVLTCLYWFNPVVWIANLHLRREREMACDDLVLRATRREGKQYTSTILRVVESFIGDVPVGAGFLGLLEISDNLLWRIRSAADATQARRIGWRSAVAIALVAALFVPMGVWTPQSLAAAPQPAAPAGAPPALSGAAPQIVSVSPQIGASNVDPATKEIRVTFDQDMGGGFSWTGGGPYQVQGPGQPSWVDKRTCVLPVTLEAGKFYRVGINSPSHQNFRGVNGVSAQLRAIYFATKGASPADLNALKPPNVVSMQPANNAKNVPSTLTQLTVTFDQPMGPDYSWVGSGENYPEAIGRPQWSADKRACTLSVKLKPNWSYQLALNSMSYNSFQSDHGVPLMPVMWTFSTGN